MVRLISHSEIAKVMTCQAQHDFAYGDQLAGSSLRPKTYAPYLSEGRAFGAAAAAYHANLDGETALEAMDVSLDEDAERQKEFGVFDEDAYVTMRTRLLAILIHYIESTEDWRAEPITEWELLTPIPSRTGGRSNKYRLLAYIDAVREIEGRTWLVEFKLRRTLSGAEMLQLERQVQRYSWAWWQVTGTKPAGVEVVERLNEAPQPVRMVQNRRRAGEKVPSHAKNQMTTPEAYLDACSEFEVSPVPDTLEALRQRRWQQMFPIQFRDGELEEAGKELVSAAKLIRDLDSGELYPVRNAKPQNCRGCAFKEICPAPDPGLVDALFERVPPKRDRDPEEERR
jgi:PD-(D/E)XK nuclease superfamily